MARYLDPKNDLTFKRIFGEHPHLLISFLNAIMPFETGRFIEEIQYLPAEQVPDNPGKKDSIVDVKCIDNYKRQFIVEMQMYWTAYFKNRMVFNAGKAYVRQLKKKEDYKLLQPVYSLGILNDTFDHKTDQFYHHFQIVNRENTDEVIPGLEFVLVELPKFCPQSWEKRKLAVLWLRFLNEVDEDMRTLPKEFQENEEISQAVEICEESAFTPAELAAYDRYWDVVRREKSAISGALAEGEIKGEARGEAKGLAKGRAEGLAKGRAEGLAKGRAEGRAGEKLEIAKNMKKIGIPIEQIAKVTHLTVAEIEQI